MYFFLVLHYIHVYIYLHSLIGEMVWFTSFPPYWFQIIGVTGSKKVGNDATQKYKYKMITVDGFQLIPNEIHRYTVTLLGYILTVTESVLSPSQTAFSIDKLTRYTYYL